MAEGFIVGWGAHRVQGPIKSRAYVGSQGFGGLRVLRVFGVWGLGFRV